MDSSVIEKKVGAGSAPVSYLSTFQPVSHERLRKRTVEEEPEPFIPYGRQWIDDADVQAVAAVLRSDRLTQGPNAGEFEKAFAQYVGSRYAVTVTNGTAALHLACQAADLGPGDQVITSPLSFVASANCAVYVGAKPGFVDIDPDTYTLDPLKLEAYLNQAACKQAAAHRAAPNKPKAVIPVHFGGWPCNMSEIHRVAKEKNLVVIEDACHALGAAYRGGGPKNGNRGSETKGWIRVGSCAHAHMAVFSFHPVKHITTGEGGMVTTNDPTLYKRLLQLRNHGIVRDPDRFIQSGRPGTVHQKAPPWYYEMQELGFNYRMTDIQCALGLSQLKKADVFMDLRRQIADCYREGLRAHTHIRLPREAEGIRSSNHLFPVQIDFKQAGRDRQTMMEALERMGIGTQVHYIPIPHHPFYQRMGFRKEDYPETEKFYERCLSLPIFPGLTHRQVARIMEALKKLL